MRCFILSLLLPGLAIFCASEAQSSACLNASNYLLLEKAQNGDVEAQLYLGNQLLMGDCSTEEKHRGVAMIEAAADAGHLPALFLLGSLQIAYAKTDAEEAVANAMITRAAEAGLAEAQSLLGVLTLEKATNREERDQAMYWLGSAASQGSAHAAMAAHTIYAHGMHGISQDKCLALLWAEAAQLLSGEPIDFLDSVSAACQ
ncbi:MAG: hypothetical protein AAGA12_12030 [Pseudomonadota bacterium]